ncbi:uncharacterized protein LOC118235110 isoform X3 [Anguilla anguilla]|uniref:uncharacterized protein LOC118235110 isoform X3 n=1 Tax=Anguilla anguilla TaxID=7936 RepID=UPI0015A8F510|nr:uncharacterized protein LOC118235110 isoform X3 [Anguilla anguilla]
MQANSSITRGSGENGTSQHVTTVHQPQNRNTPDQSQDTFILNQTGKHGVMQGILGNSKSFGLLVGGNMSPGILNDACSGYTEVEQIFDYWMTGLDHVSNDKTGDAGQEFSHEVQKNLVGQEPPPVKQETKILTHTSKAGLSTQAGYCVRNPQWKCDSTEKENEKLEGSGLSGDPFVNRKGSLIGNACHQGNDKYYKHENLDLKDLPHSTPLENRRVFCASHIEMESRELKHKPQDIKGEDAFWSEGESLPQFDVWMESLKESDCQHTSNEDIKPDCLDSKELFKAMSAENDHSPQVHQHVSDKVARTDYLKKPICVSQIEIENKKIKCEPRDMEEGEVMLSEALGHIKNERQEVNKAERENIHKSGKRFVKTQIRLESSQMEIDHHFVRKQEKAVKPDSRNLEISPGLRNDLQNTFHVKHEREVNAECLGVKKEDPVWTVNSIKQEIYTDGRSDCRVSVDPIWASHSLQTQSKIANTDNICNDKKSFPKNVPECTKSVDFKAESYLKDEDPNWAFHCFSRSDTSHLKSPPPSNSQTSDEFQRPSNMIASDPQQEAPVPVQQIFPSGFSHQVRTAQDPSVQTATQISPMLNQKEVAQKQAAQQSFQYSQGEKCFSSHDTLKVPTIMHENDPYIVEQLKQLSFCRLCGEKQILHLQKGDVLNGKIVLTPKCSSSEKEFWKCCLCKRGFRTRGRIHLHQHVHLRKLSKPKIKCPKCKRKLNISDSLRKCSEVHIQGTVPCKSCVISSIKKECIQIAGYLNLLIANLNSSKNSI